MAPNAMLISGVFEFGANESQSQEENPPPSSQPEALIYELRNGELRLVGVGYVVIAEAWDAAHEHHSH